MQVVLGERNAGEPDSHGDPSSLHKELGAMVVNRGSFTITSVDARFRYNRGATPLFSPARSKRLTGFADVRDRVRDRWHASAEHAMDGVLTPRDAGIRFESYVVPASELTAPYPIVRWIDRWGTQWQYERGVVRRVLDDEQWAP